jgi:two-component system NtrC family response regulator
VRTASLLVVDDDPLAARYMNLALSEDFADVRCAASGVDALLAVEARVPDLVLTDLQMPEMDGLELLAHLRERWPEVPVILVTVEQDVATVVDALRQGAVNYLVKPVSPPVLLTAVRKALTRSTVATAHAPNVSDLIGVSDAMVRIRHLVALAARSDANVLITGETGTGKDLVARAIHRLSKSADGPFVAHNCAVTPGDLFESQFFGHRRGAFTGADRDQCGLLKEADGGILFLDELECLSLPHQAKLLRVLDDGIVRPVGAAESWVVSVRVLSATNRSPDRMLAEGTLREDLYYRLRGFEVSLPPLRERRGDVPALVEHFLSGRGVVLSPEAASALEAFPWPGNVRQLRSVLAGATNLATDGLILRRHLRLGSAAQSDPPEPQGAEEGTLKELARSAILTALRQESGNRIRAARALGIHRSTLRRKMEELGIRA